MTRALSADRKSLPASVLFACNLNSIRSTMAEAILKKLHGNRIFVDSAGVRPAEEPDPFTAEVLREDGMTPPAGSPKGFDDLEETSFDLIVALTPEARDKAEELTRTSATDVEFWAIDDPLASPPAATATAASPPTENSATSSAAASKRASLAPGRQQRDALAVQSRLFQRSEL